MSFINGMISIIGYMLNTVFWVIPLLFFALIKLIPVRAMQSILSYAIDGCAQGWVKVNTLNQQLLSRTHINVSPLPNLSDQQWYMVIANHQSSVDILILQRVLQGKVPFLKFFLKHQLIYMPVLGLAWWALDFPFMRRYSRALLAKKPHLKGQDIAETRKSCEKFQFKPVSVVNFVEGTRFTQQKQQQQQSPFDTLLKPKAGGLAFTLNVMSGRLNQLVDVTISYPNGVPSFWDFVSGNVEQVDVDVTVEDITPNLLGNYDDDDVYKANFQQWLNEKWAVKQEMLAKMK